MSLNKADRLKKQREDNAEEVEEVLLEPRFPYKVESFDTTFFDRSFPVEKKGD